MSVQSEMTALADQVRRLSGETALLGISAMTAALAGVTTGGGGGSGVTVTEYIVTENADRSLWLNEQGIRLVKGLNLLLLSGWEYGGSIVNNRSGLTTLILILWDGVSVSEVSQTNLGGASNHLRGFYFASNGYTYQSATNVLTSGNTSKLSVDEDGLLTLTTSATGVTTGNYANSFVGAGNTYKLYQIGNEVLC